jgi:GxxExxY protein
MTRETDAKFKTDAKLLYKEESYVIQGGAFEIYKQFRNRHKETVYSRALTEYLKNKKLKVETEKQIPIYFENKKVGVYIPDIVVNDCIFVELKCKPLITQDDIKQFWHYLKCSNYKIGYLINFGSPKGVQIIRRIYDTARNC